jgi:hypothetical protein
MSRRLRIVRIGNLGNQLLQYVVATSLARVIGNCEITGFDLPILKGNKRVPPASNRGQFVLRGHVFDYRQVARLVANYHLRRITLRGLGHRCENFVGFQEFRNLIELPAPPVTFGESELVINIRGAEVLGNRHPDYGPVPVTFYEQLIEQSRKDPVFVGQIGDDEYSLALRQRFPKARFIGSQGPVSDFAIIAAARHLVPSVSAFSWMAAWVSSAATIHLPALGMLNPRQRPDVNLLPVDDPRYRFYEFPIRKWAASVSDFAWLQQRNTFSQMSGAQLNALKHEAEISIGGLKDASARRLEKAARLEWLSERLGLDYLPVVR